MYQALYRKWRPRTFDEVAGQEHITETLKSQLASGRLSHAYLFVGTRGTGKTSCAKILSRAVNCEHPENGNPCNRCPSCLGIENGSILDVVELDAASNNGVDNVRALRDEAVFSPVSVKKRVYIIDEVHMLSGAAFNALLKILEEPPEHLMFILATTELHKIPATILSRCQRFSFRRLLPSDIEKRLTYVAGEEGIDLMPDGSELLARLADGSMRDALSLLDQCPRDGKIDAACVTESIGLAGAGETVRLFGSIAEGGTADALSMLDTLYKNGKDLASLVDELTSLVRDIMVVKLSPSAEGLLSGNFSTADLRSFAKKIRASRLLVWLDLLRAAASDMPSSSNTRLTAEICLIRMCDTSLAGDIGSLADRVGALEEKLDKGVFAIRAEAPPASDTSVLSREAPPAPARAEEAAPAPEETVPDIPAAPAETASAGAPASSAGEDIWPKVLKKALPDLDKPMDIYLSDPSGTRAEYADGILTVLVKNQFLLDIADTPKINGVLRDAASAVVGAPVRVRFAPDRADTEKAGDRLEALNRFSNVRFE